MNASLNNTVWVKLTDCGLEQLNRYVQEQYRDHGSQRLVIALHKRRRVWYEFTLGELMKVFGPLCDSVFGPPFLNGEVFFERPY